MRRVLLPLTGLVAGTTLLISLKSAPGATRLPHEVVADALAAAQAQRSAGSSSLPPEAAPDGAAPAAPGPTDGGPPAELESSPAPPAGPEPTTGTKPPPPPPTPTRPPPPGPPPPDATRSVTGDSAYTEFGYVTVAITVTGTLIVDVVAVELPSEHSRSVSINNRAGPILREWALEAQSADIDTVSGATYTSEGFRESLQSALDKAGLATR